MKKKILSLIISLIIVISTVPVSALNIDKAYTEFKKAHPEFINNLVANNIDEQTIITFMKDVDEYLSVIGKGTPITHTNFEECAMTAVMDVSSREKYYTFQDSLLILYPEAIKLAVTEGKVADEFRPLVNTIKAIYFKEDSPAGGGGGGGSTSSNDKEPDEDDKEEVISPTPSENKFTDIKDSHWAYKSVKYLADNFIISGYLDGTFKPENNITRAEFAKIIISATNKFDEEATSSFKDVDSDDWHYAYVSTAYSLGYITGYPDGSFRPDANITRADICTIVNRVLNATPSQDTEKFNDDDSIPSYAKDAVYALSSMGVINGYSNKTFAPTTFATRAQTAKIIFTAFFQEKE